LEKSERQTRVQDKAVLKKSSFLRGKKKKFNNNNNNYNNNSNKPPKVFMSVLNGDDDVPITITRSPGWLQQG